MKALWEHCGDCKSPIRDQRMAYPLERVPISNTGGWHIRRNEDISIRNAKTLAYQQKPLSLQANRNDMKALWEHCRDGKSPIRGWRMAYLLERGNIDYYFFNNKGLKIPIIK